jgi:SagB-type dehydrogenase family enzyme
MDARGGLTGVTGRYHDHTKYHPATIHTLQRPLATGRMPSPFHEPDNVPLLDLTPWLPAGDEWRSDAALVEHRMALEAAWRDFGRLSQMLYLSYGITGVIRTPQQQFLMRAAPSAGALYPADLYLVVTKDGCLEAGVYLYQPRQHVLARVAGPPAVKAWTEAQLDDAVTSHDGLWVVLAGHFPRSSWRYQARAYRRVLLDTGHLWANLMEVSSLVGYQAVPCAAFRDHDLNQMLGLHPGFEGALMVVALVDHPERAAWSKGFPPLRNAVTQDSVEYLPDDPDACIWVTHEACNLEHATLPGTEEPSAEPVWRSLGELVRLPHSDEGWHDKLGATLLKRRSSRAFEHAPWSLETLGGILKNAYGALLADGLRDHIKTYVVAHAIVGLDEGAYHYDPVAHTLRQTRFRNLKVACGHLALGQALAEDATAIVFHTANLGVAQRRFDERAYRYLHLMCGAIGQLLNLHAVARGMGASGIGGFFDDDVNETLGIPDGEAVLYITTLGVPRNPD